MRFFRLCNDDVFPMDKEPSEGYESLVEMEQQCKKQIDLSKERNLFQLERGIKMDGEKLKDKLNKVKMLEQRINKIVDGFAVFEGKNKKIELLNKKEEPLSQEELVELQMHQSKNRLLEACRSALGVISQDIELKISALNSKLANGHVDAGDGKQIPDFSLIDGFSAVADFSTAVVKAFFEKPAPSALPFFKMNTSRIRGGLFGSLSSTHDVANEVASLLALEDCDKIFEQSKQGAAKTSVASMKLTASDDDLVMFARVEGANVSFEDYKMAFQEEEADQRMRYSPSHDAML